MKSIKVLALGCLLSLTGTVYAANSSGSGAPSNTQHKADSCCVRKGGQDGASCCSEGASCCSEGASCCHAEHHSASGKRTKTHKR